MAKNTLNPLQVWVRKGIRDAINQINGAEPDPPVNPPSQGSESWYRDRLARKLKGKTEVQTPAGRIDIVTQTEIIELKSAPNWKAAIGQIKCYGEYYPNHRQRIHLFGEIKETKLKMMQRACQQENIELTWE
ncbi:MAG: hypothetical protein GC158_05970 [Cyanobacteria bacterium RI_101]|nr:hypothetical protein [Cyanobacteria bacterium RI_101]